MTYERKPAKVRPNMDNLSFWGAALDFIEETRFDQDLIIDVVRHPTESYRDPKSMEVGYNIYRFRRGDITVVVGFRDMENPKIIYIYLHDPEEHRKTAKGSRTGAGSGSKTPTTMNGLQTWLRNQGCVLSWEHKSGVMTVTWRGIYVGNLHSTPSGGNRSLKNMYHRLSRNLQRVKTEESLRQDIDIRERRSKE